MKDPLGTKGFDPSTSKWEPIRLNEPMKPLSTEDLRIELVDPSIFIDRDIFLLRERILLSETSQDSTKNEEKDNKEDE